MKRNQNKRWLISSPITPQANETLAAFPPIMRQILFNRGIADDSAARTYLYAEETRDLSPFKMNGIRATVERIWQAINQHEKIVVYGDYDVDGVTATALLYLAIRGMGGEVKEYIPNRFDEGYGLNTEAISALLHEGAQLVISVDCGIRSNNEAAYAKDRGLDLIISDHHQPATGDLPPALAIVNPKQSGDPYPEKDLAGVGVAYKIVQALLEYKGFNQEDYHLEDLLDLVALGTVADLAPLIGENRILVRKGLQKLRETKRQGIFSLAAISGISLKNINAMTIGFILGPRLNAAGRLESAMAAFDLLTTSDVKRAGELAQLLNVQNHQRQEITRKIQSEAEAMIDEDSNENLLFAVHPDFNSGVVGLAAARLVDSYYRPAIVGQISEETTRCSCRSIPEFHITEALDQCQDLLIRHGGHAAAAGFTVRNENRDALKARLQQLASERFKGIDLRQTLIADIEIPLSELKPGLLEKLASLQPTGYGNPEALFVSRNVRVINSRAVGSESKHLKLVVTDGHISYDAIGFQLGHLQTNLPEKLDLLFTFESNEFNGRTTLQLNLKDIKPAGALD